MDLCGFKCFLIAYILALVARSTTSDCGGVEYVHKPHSREDFHSLWSSNSCYPRKYESCLLTFWLKDDDDGFDSLLYQLCTEGFYTINCIRREMGTITVSSSFEKLELYCSQDFRDKKICAPRGEDLVVYYKGNLLCAGDMVQEIKDFLGFYHQSVFSNVMPTPNSIIYDNNAVLKLATTDSSCQHRIDSRKTAENNGTIVSFQKDGGKYFRYCPAYVDLSPKVKEFCVHIVELDSPEGGTSLEISTYQNRVVLPERTMRPRTGDVCLPIGYGDEQVSFTILFTRRGRHHTFLLEYYSVFEEEDDDDDDDDDNNDLYWLFVIPGVAILIWCCYYCCKEDKDENGAQDQPGEGSEVQAPPEALGIPNEHNRDRGDETIHLTLGAAEPSAPPLIEPPPPSYACSGDEPPSYHLLFPDQKHS